MRLIAIITAVLLLAACGLSKQASESSTPSAPATITVSGTITVSADSMSSEQAMGGACVTDDGYSDISSGAQVRVEDSAGKVIALAALQAGHVSEVFGPGTAVEGMAYLCVFGFTVNDVPAEEKIYSVEVTHRGKISFTREKLNEPIALTLG
ncbi:hypothetical protein [Kribbella sp. NPDC051620]|uniref:hypothetical protein n=1 Tax=Kribbella sp. NPDC051620 TaxID=3364120 RepID=UPI0037B3EB8A